MGTNTDNWIKDIDSAVEENDPKSKLYIEEVQNTLNGLSAKKCSAAIIQYTPSSEHTSEIGLVYSADLTQDGLIVTDYWVLPKYWDGRIFFEIARWWLIHLFSKFSTARQ